MRVLTGLTMGVFNQGSGNDEFGIDVAGGVQAEVSDLHEDARQDVERKSPHEFQNHEPADLFAASAKDDFVAVDVQQRRPLDDSTMCSRLADTP
jgi:hypothetical protein